MTELPLLSQMARRQPAIFFIAPAVLWALFIFFLSNQSGDSFPKPSIPFADKIVHLVLYGTFGLLVARAWGFGRPISWKIAALCLLTVIAYGATDEFHQRFIPERSCDIRDWFADLTGAVLGILFWKQILFSRLPFSSEHRM